MMNENINWKIPHMIKIPEAFSALADQRYEFKNDFFLVYSSNRKRQYTVTVHSDGYASNDNMSFNKGILGYPVVVHLLLKERISFDKSVAMLFKNINWTELNLQCNKDFTMSYNIILNRFSKQGMNTKLINEKIQDTFEQLCVLIPTIKRYQSNITFEESLIK